MFLHEMDKFKEFVETTAREMNGMNPSLVEKDYWIMHCLWGLKTQGLEFYMKGGTSLSKGFGIIDRFSEDIDIMIVPPKELNVKTSKNHMKEAHIKSRADFYDYLKDKINIPGIKEVVRDKEFDDDKMRNGGLRLIYEPLFGPVEGLKDGILLEVGFDIVTPNRPVNISSWLVEKTIELSKYNDFDDNRANDIDCYLLEYTFVEKLQTVSRKYRIQQAKGEKPANFLRHYYDIYQLLDQKCVQDFIGTEEYLKHKDFKFKNNEEKDLTKNDAFIIASDETKEQFEKAFSSTDSLYYKKRPTLKEILDKLSSLLTKL